jgi:hypothetical protein
MVKLPIKQLFAKNLEPGTKFLLGLWLFFLILVASGIHGSSTGITAHWWAPEKPYSAYLFQPPASLLQNLSQPVAERLRGVFQAQPRFTRWDEFSNATPLALSQLSHSPRFPVINTNIGQGQNMLIQHHTPVWHIATLARPATWGYFIFGARRGLAWSWWLQLFGCFTVLYLLLRIILRRHEAIAAFGALWYCGSAYVACWSQWPAYSVFFPALACLAAYHLLNSKQRSTQVICSVLLGLSIPGFLMLMYPPWQVPLTHLFLLLLIGLLVRDKLYLSLRHLSRHRLLCILGALSLACLLSLSFVLTCLPALKTMSATVYPGKRVSLGGDYSLAQIFKGFYNLITIYETPPFLLNQSEAASFYYLFPGVFLALALSKRLRGHLGVFGWLLISYLIAMLFFLLVGIPEWIAKITLLSYVPSYRADIAIGLASIILCVYVLVLIKDQKLNPEDRWEKLVPWIVSVAAICLFIFHRAAMLKMSKEFPALSITLAVALLAGLVSYCLIAGNSKAFCAIMCVAILATTAPYNPLSTNLDHIYDSELAHQITRLNRESGDRPFWICYGGTHPGVLVYLLGGRSLSGIHWPPQLALWSQFDYLGYYPNVYNRYAEVQLAYEPVKERISFSNHQDGAFVVSINPNHLFLKRLGARYVLAMGDAQPTLELARLPVVYKSTFGNFSIYEIPPLMQAEGLAPAPAK